MSASPVTPQRIPRSSVSTPYTPLSLHSFTSNSSTLTTPSSISQSARTRTKRLNLNSPNVSIVSDSHGVISSNKKSHKSCLSDIADSWRSRANEHGIKVSVSQSTGEDSHYGDDEASDRAFSDVNDASFVTAEEVLLPPAFLSTHRRPRAQSQALPPTNRSFNTGPLQPTSPNVLRTPARSARLANLLPSSAPRASLSHVGPFMSAEVENRIDNIQAKHNIRTFSSHSVENAIMCTPPPNKARAKSLKMKGSFTDPAVLRRRPGVDSTPIRSKHDLSSQSLFNIDENDFEEEDDHNYEPSFNQYEYEQSFDYDHEYVDAMAGGELDSLSIPENDKQQMQNDHFVYSQLAANDFTDRLNMATNFAQMLGMNVTPSYGINTFGSIPSFTQYPSPLPMQNIPLSMPQQLQSMPAPPLPSLYHPAFNTHFSQSTHGPILGEKCDSGMGYIAHNAEDQFHARHRCKAPRPSSPASIDSDASKSGSSTINSAIQPAGPPSRCSVCHRSAQPTFENASLSLAILSPCNHPLCSACLTSALNIVGEKDMECAVCKKAVSSFKLVNVTPEPSVKHRDGQQFKSHAKGNRPSSPAPLGDVDINRLPLTVSTPKKARNKENIYSRGHSFLDPLFSSPGSVGSTALGTGFDLGFSGPDNGLDALHINDGLGMAFDSVRASTPKNERELVPTQNGGRAKGRRNDEAVVLRIDNVPWDITPPAICAWLEQPVLRVHVLLDRKGKTLSHAFVEVEDEEIAGAILRGEGFAKCGKTRLGGPKMRSSVLGKGKRARGVTVTRSSQDELMRALFPSWRGAFDGSKPSLAGLDNEHVISTLEGGLMSESEIMALLALVQTPDSHFLKVPSLPFHSLISILSKFPTDVDSRVFWSGVLRDLLYDLTHAALRILLSRATGQSKDADGHRSLFDQLYKVAIGCQAFTDNQITLFERLQDSGMSLSNAQELETIDSPRENSALKPAEPPTLVPIDVTVSDPTPLERQDDALKIVNLSPTLPSAHSAKVEVGNGSLDDLAREFGINPQLIEALAQRLHNTQS